MPEKQKEPYGFGEIPEVLAAYLRELAEDGGQEEYLFFLSERRLGNGAVQEIAGGRDGGDFRRTVFGFAPICGIVRLCRRGASWVLSLSTAEDSGGKTPCPA